MDHFIPRWWLCFVSWTVLSCQTDWFYQYSSSYQDLEIFKEHCFSSSQILYLWCFLGVPMVVRYLATTCPEHEQILSALARCQLPYSPSHRQHKHSLLSPPQLHCPSCRLAIGALQPHILCPLWCPAPYPLDAHRITRPTIPKGTVHYSLLVKSQNTGLKSIYRESN